MPSTPIVNAGLLYVNGLNIAYVSSTSISMSAGAARNSTNINDIILQDNTIIYSNRVGFDGLDSGQLLPNKFYAVYVIGDSNRYQPTAGLLSLNFIEPNLPSSYDMYRRIGWVLTDSSSLIKSFFQNGDGQERMYYYQLGILALLNGTSTTFTEVDLSIGMPSLTTDVLLLVSYFPSNVINSAQFLPFGAIGLGGSLQFGYGTTNRQIGMMTVPCQINPNTGNSSIIYKVLPGDSIVLNLAGYKDILT